MIPASSSGSSGESSLGSTNATSDESITGTPAAVESDPVAEASKASPVSDRISIQRPRYVPPTTLLLGSHVPGTPSLEWGESLFHFYTISRYPGVRNIITYSTSSKLAAWLRDCERRYGSGTHVGIGGSAEGEVGIDERKRKLIMDAIQEDKRIAYQELDDARKERKPRLVMEDSRKEVWKWEYENKWGEEWIRVRCILLRRFLPFG